MHKEKRLPTEQPLLCLVWMDQDSFCSSALSAGTVTMRL